MEKKNKFVSQLIISILVACLVGVSLFYGTKLYTETQKINEIKEDFAEINKLEYGLFNIDIWKESIFGIIQKKADGFDFDVKDLGGIKMQIESYLYELHKDYFESGKLATILMEDQKNAAPAVKLMLKLFKGTIDKQIRNIDFKSQIPIISERMMSELKKKIPEIKKGISKQVSDMLVQEATSSINDERSIIYEKYGVLTSFETNDVIRQQVIEKEVVIKQWLYYTLAPLFMTLLLLLLLKSLISFKTAMIWMTIICCVFLYFGLALPMIDLDARLIDVNLQIIGETLHFDEQVMYYQSKSIIDVTRTLLQGNAFDLKFVGILILLFSIVLPFIKMILSLYYVISKSIKRNKVIEIVIFYLGKWSMADVFVVAILMSYIGFYGLLSTQLGSMAGASDEVNLKTVNYSSLSPGVIFFSCYCIFSIVMSTLIHRRKEKGVNLDQINPNILTT